MSIEFSARKSFREMRGDASIVGALRLYKFITRFFEVLSDKIR